MNAAARRMSWLVLAALSAALASCAQQAAVQAPASPASADTADAGPPWRKLFNGRDLDGWQTVGSAAWRVEDGVIVGTQDGDPKRGGLLVTRDAYGDFEFELEFMIDEHGKYNSGVYLRCQMTPPRRTGYQVNIGRGAAGEYCGGLYLKQWLAKGDEQDTIRKKLAWNSMRIVARGPAVTIDLNGVNVAKYVDPSPDPKLLEPGVLALQTYGAEGHAGWVKFRHLRIREVK